MNLNSLFNHSRFSSYSVYLKSRGLSDASIQRQLSSLNTFQKFLVKKKLVSAPESIPLTPTPPVQAKPVRFQFSLRSYLIVAGLVILLSGLAYGLYSQTIVKAKQKYAYSTASAPVMAGRFLSFQGRLTDSAGNPIQSSTSVRFKLFDVGATGTGSTLYDSWVSYGGSIGATAVTPDANGIFSVIIGQSYGDTIPTSVFTEHPAVFMEITAGGETMNPRQQIATVAYAVNAETLQGLPPSASGLKNTVMVVGESGYVYLGESNPSIIASNTAPGSTFRIEGQALLLDATNSLANSNIKIDPVNPNGAIQLVTNGSGASNAIVATNANLSTGNLFFGKIGNDNRGYNFIDFQNFNVGTSVLQSRFSVSAGGNVNVGATLNAANISIGNTLISSTATELSFLHGTTTNAGSVIYGNGSYLANTAVGASGQFLMSNSTSTPVWATPAGTIYTASNGVTLVGNDFRLGGNLTGNTQIGTSNYSLSFLGLGGTQSLFIGASGNVGIGTTSPTHLFQIGSINGNTFTIDTTGTAAFRNYYSTETNPRYSLDSSILGSGLPGIGFRGNTDASLITNGSAIGLPSNRVLAFYTSDSSVLAERMRIDASGNVGIGTTNPGYTLQIGGTGSLGVGGSVTFSGLPVATGTSIAYINSSGVISKGLLGPFDNYQSWTANVGTSNLTVGSTSTLTFAAGTGIQATLVGNTLTITNNGAGTTYAFTNGLTDPGTHVIGLGGSLIANTQIGMSSSYLSFLGLGSTQSLYISSTGNIGIGTTDTRYTLNLNGQIYSNNNISSEQYGSFSTSNTNYVAQSSFENSMGGFTFQQAPNVGTTSTDRAVFGSYSLKITRSVGSSEANVYQNLTLNIGQTYSYSAWTWADAPNVACIFTLNGSTNLASKCNSGNSQWERLSGTFIPNGGTGVIQLRLGNQAVFSPTGDSFYFDGVQVEILTSSSPSAYLDNGSYIINKTAGLYTPQNLTVSGNSYLGLSGGNVGIGTTNPSQKLDVNGSVNIGGSVAVGTQIYAPNLTVGTGTSVVYFNSTGQLTKGLLGPFDNYQSWNLLSNSTGSTAVTSAANVNFVNGVGISLSQSGSTITINNNGVGTTYGATNGLNLSSYNFGLGGTLTGNTTISTSTYGLGIGTAANALYDLNVGTTANFVNLFTSGNVGIGTTNPTGKLYVSADNNGLSRLYFVNPNTGANRRIDLSIGTSGAEMIYLGVDQAAAVYGGTSYAYLDNRSGGKFTYGYGGSPQLTIDTTGNLGIGTTGPGTKLEVYKATSGNLLTLQTDQFAIGDYSSITLANDKIDGNGSYGSEIRNINTVASPSPLEPRLGFFLQNPGTYLAANRTERMTILNTGNVGIGTTNPLYKLDVNGNVNIGGSIIANGIGTGVGTSVVYISGTTGNLTEGLLGPFDNYQSWNLLANSTGTTAVTSAANVNFVNGVGISLSQSGSTITINNNGVGTTYGATNGLNLSGYNFGLGGTLTGNTTISTSTYGLGIGTAANALYDLNVGTTANFVNLFTSGNVGIGTSNPAYSLDVQSAATSAIIRIGNTVNQTQLSELVLLSDKSTVGIWAAGSGYTSFGGTAAFNIYNSAGPIAFTSNGAVNSMFINGGNVGIGTTSPGYKLTVQGGDGNTPGILLTSGGGSTATFLGIGRTGSEGLLGVAGMAANYWTSAAPGDLILRATVGKLNLATGYTAPGITIDTSGNVGVGTSNPQAAFHLLDNYISIYSGGSTSTYTSNFLIQGIGTTRSPSNGSSIGFIAPANTDGSNSWEQARIIGGPDNTNNGNATGRLSLQTRYFNGTSWTWRDNLVLSGTNGYVGIGTTNPGSTLDVVGAIRASVGVTSPLITLSTGAGAGKLLQSDASGNASWVTAAGVGGTYTATNGLNLSGAAFGLGGTLTGNTTISTSTYGLGIGTAANALYDLNVGTTANFVNLFTSGNVGIGTTSPGSLLDVNGNATIGGYQGIYGYTGKRLEVVGGDANIWDGSVLGSELHTSANAASDPNGNEANATTGWSGSATIISSTTAPSVGSYDLDISGGAAAYAHYSMSLSAGTLYKVVVNTQVISGGAEFYVSDGVGNGWNANRIELVGLSGSGSYNTKTFYFVANSTSATFSVWIQSAGTEVYVDNLSIKKVMGGNLATRGLLTGGGTSGIKIDSLGNVGIGTTAPGAFLHVNGTYSTATAGEQYGEMVTTAYSIADTNYKQGLRLNTTATNTSGSLASLVGLLALNSSSGSGGTTTASYPLWTRIDAATGATVTTGTNLLINNGTGAGTITTQNGIVVNALTKGTNNAGIVIDEATGTKNTNLLIGTVTLPTGSYSIYNSSTDNNYFAGNVGIGTTSPGQKLDVIGAIRASVGVTSPIITLSTGAGAGKLLQSDASGNASWVTASGIGGTVTASNGLTMVGSDVRLGGTLSALTKINQNGFDFGFYGTGDVGIGTTSPEAPLHVYTGHAYGAGFTNLAILNNAATGNANDQGALAFKHTDTGNGVAWFPARIAADKSWDGTNFGGSLLFQTKTIDTSQATQPTTKMVILNNGNVGIGTTNPSKLLTVNGDMFLGAAASGGVLNAYQLNINTTRAINDAINFITNAGYSMTILANGNVGIGTTNPSSDLDVVGAIRASVGVTSPLITLSTGAGAGKLLQSDASGNASWVTSSGVGGYTATNGLNLSGTAFGLGGALTQNTRLNIGNTEVLYLQYSTGNVGIGTTAPNSLLTIGNASLNGFNVNEIRLGNTSANSYFRAGQDATHSLYLGWTYNATAGNAVAEIGTYGGSNALALQTSGGNVGIGTTAPKTTLQVGAQLGILEPAAGFVNFTKNAYYSSGWKYTTTDEASLLGFSNNGDFSLSVAPSGSADAGISFVTPFKIESAGSVENTLYLKTGNVGIGTTGPINQLTISGSQGILNLGATGWVDPGITGGSIVTDNSVYKALMIVGNNISGNSGKGREVKLWDFLNIQGQLSASGNIGIGTTGPVEKLEVIGGGIRLGTTSNANNVLDTAAAAGAPSGNLYWGSRQLVDTTNIANFGVSSITGTANQITVSAGGTGAVTLSVPSNFIPPGTVSAVGRISYAGVPLDATINYDSNILFSPQAYIENNSSIFSSYGTEVGTTETGIPFSQVMLTSNYIQGDNLGNGDYIPVRQGEILYGEIWVKRNVGAVGATGTVYAGMMIYDANLNSANDNGGRVYPFAGGYTVPTDGVWHKLSAEYTVPAAAAPGSGPVSYVHPLLFINYNAGTIPTYWAGFIIRRKQVFRDSGDASFAGQLGIGTASPGTQLDVVGNIRASGLTGLTLSGAGADLNFSYSGSANTISTTNSHLGLMTGSGNVGIGTTNPTQKLHIAGSGVNLQIGDAGGAALYFNNTSNNISYNNNQFQFNTTQSQGFTFNGGHVGIGTTNPAGLLQLGAGSFAATNAGYQEMHAGAFGILFRNNYDSYITGNTQYTATGWVNKYNYKPNIISMADGVISFNVGTGTTAGAASNLTEKMRIDDTGNVGIGTTGPDSQLQTTGKAHLYNVFVGGPPAGGTPDYGVYTDSVVGGTNLWLSSRTGGNLYLNGLAGSGNIYMVQAGGNVSIGTTSPLSKLHIISDTNAQRWGYNSIANDAIYNLQLNQVVTSSNVRWSFDQTNSSVIFPNVLVFEKGNVGIGMTSPLYQFQVAGEGVFTQIGIGVTGTAKLNVVGDANITTNLTVGTTITSATAISSIFIDKDSTNYYLDPANAGSTLASSLNLHGDGSIRFNTYGLGNTFVVANKAATRILNFPNGLLLDVGNTGAANSAITWTNNQFFLNTSGSVGIGTTNPAYPLNLYKASAETGLALDWGTTRVYLSHGGWGMGAGKFGIGDGSAPSIVINTANDNVGIGTTGPGYALQVESGKNTDPYLQAYFNSTMAAGYGGIGVNGINQSHVRFFINGSQKWQIAAGAGAGTDVLNVYSWTTGSNVMTFLNNGKVGIGTTGPLSKFSVGGVGIAGAAVYGTSGGGYGVYGVGDTGGYGVFGTSDNGIGVYGASPSNVGVYGNGGGAGVWGNSDNVGGYGLYGISNGNGGYGVLGIAPSGGTGVYGSGGIYDFYAANSSSKSYFNGKVGISTTNPLSKLSVGGSGTGTAAVYGTVTGYGGFGIYGDGGASSSGVYGTGNYGVYGNGAIALYGTASGGAGSYAVYGAGSNGGIAVFGTGGTEFSGGNGEHTVGGVWTNGSDRNLKENFTAIDNQAIYNKILQLPITEWNYKTAPGSRFIGPMAQDFNALFGVGDSVSISSIDPAAIALIGIKVLDTKLDGLDISSEGQVNVNYNVSSNVLSSLGYSGSKNEIETAAYNLTDSLGQPVSRLAQFAQIAAGKVQAGLLSVENIVAKNIIAESTKSKTVSTAIITPLSDLSDTITVAGNLNIANTLSATDASISGNLYATKIISADGDLSQVMTDKISSLRSEIQNFIASTTLPAPASSSAIATAAEGWTYDAGTSQVAINGSLSLTDNLVVGSKLTVQGQATLGSAFITGTFTAGEIAIKDNLIETTNTALYIQPSKIGSVHIMGETLVITDAGSVEVNGNLAINGNLTTATATISGSLFANLITADEITTKKLTTDQLNVATDSATTIIAEGGFAQLATSSAQINSNAVAGTATLPAGKTSLVINNPKVTAASMVYLTPNGSTNNQVLYVKDKSASPTPTPNFTIAIDQPLATDIQVNWWIIN